MEIPLNVFPYAWVSSCSIFGVFLIRYGLVGGFFDKDLARGKFQVGFWEVFSLVSGLLNKGLLRKAIPSITRHFVGNVMIGSIRFKLIFGFLKRGPLAFLFFEVFRGWVVFHCGSSRCVRFSFGCMFLVIS